MSQSDHAVLLHPHLYRWYVSFRYPTLAGQCSDDHSESKVIHATKPWPDPFMEYGLEEEEEEDSSPV